MLAIAMKFCSAGSHSVEREVRQGERHNNLGTIDLSISTFLDVFEERDVKYKTRSMPLQL